MEHGLTRKPTPGKITGRPKGSRTSYGKVGRELARKLVSSKTYLEKLQRRLERGEISPSMEAVLWAYAYGRPADSDLTNGIPKPQGAVINVITASPQQSPDKQIGRGRTTTILASQPVDIQPTDNAHNLPDNLAAQHTESPGVAESRSTPITIDVSSPETPTKSRTETPENAPESTIKTPDVVAKPARKTRRRTAKPRKPQGAVQ